MNKLYQAIVLVIFAQLLVTDAQNQPRVIVDHMVPYISNDILNWASTGLRVLNYDRQHLSNYNSFNCVEKHGQGWAVIVSETNFFGWTSYIPNHLMFFEFDGRFFYVFKHGCP